MSSSATTLNSARTLGAVPKKMRAGVYQDKGVVRVEVVPVPEVGANEVLIKVAACGICGTDIKKIFQRYVEPPQILGHELAGTVVAVGPGVSKFHPGDLVGRGGDDTLFALATGNVQFGTKRGRKVVNIVPVGN